MNTERQSEKHPAFRLSFFHFAVFDAGSIRPKGEEEMQYFLDTVDTIEEGVGFGQFTFAHWIWFVIFLAVVIVCCHFYRKSDIPTRARWRKVVALLILGDEIFKMAMLTIGGNYLPDYLPLHLCSINIFVILYHAWHPNRVLDNFLYTVCVPAAIAALLFPSWSTLPVMNFMYFHSFTIHILLALYPIMLTAGGDIRPEVRDIPKCVLFLLVLAVPVSIINILLDTNFMFLMEAEPGNPLYWFGENWGSHLLGFPVLIAGVLVVMHLPIHIRRKLRARQTV